MGFVFYLNDILISESLLRKEVRNSLNILDLSIESRFCPSDPPDSDLHAEVSEVPQRILRGR